MAKIKEYTPEGYKALQEEYNDLLKKIEENITDISTARSFGDLSENSEYDEAKTEQAKLAQKKLELEQMLENAKVLDESQIDESIISVGSRVVVDNLTRGAEFIYHIVGSYETDPKAGRISDDSPIGRALLGARAGDEVVVSGCAKEQTLRVKDVSRDKK